MAKKRKRWVLVFYHPKREINCKYVRFEQRYHTEKAANTAKECWEKGGGNLGGWVFQKSDGWESKIEYR